MKTYVVGTHQKLLTEALLMSACMNLLFAYCIIKANPPQKNRYFFSAHYETTPIQIYRKFHLQKLKIFS